MKKVDWQSRWVNGKTGWDLNGVHPGLPDLWAECQTMVPIPAGSRVYVPGCGSGHDAAFFAQQKCSVTAVDFVPEAIAAARALYGQKAGLTFDVADVLAFSEVEHQQYDFVYDRAMLCALSIEQRETYVASMAARLRPGGVFIGILFSEVVLESGRLGPPFAISVEEFGALMADRFSLMCGWEQVAPPKPEAIKREFFCLWRRKV